MTKNDHFQLVYDGQPSWYRKSSDENLHLKVGRIERQPSKFFDECLTAAKQIKSIAKKPLLIVMSGGVDSEVVSEAFRISDTPALRVTLRFNEANEQGPLWAAEYCKKHNLEMTYYDLDIKKFFDDGLYHDFVGSSQSVDPFVLPILSLIRKFGVDYSCVFGYGDMQFKRTNNKWCYWAMEGCWAVDRYAGELNFETFKFFEWSPELIMSWLSDPLYKELFKMRKDLTEDQYQQLKRTFYKSHFAFTDRPKFNDCEVITKYRNKFYFYLQKKYAHPSQEVQILIKDFLKMLKLK